MHTLPKAGTCVQRDLPVCDASHLSQASEVILSGGSAGGLGVFYNLDHLTTLLPAAVRVTGFPDAGYFMDAPGYVADFVGADPVRQIPRETRV